MVAGSTAFGVWSRHGRSGFEEVEARIVRTPFGDGPDCVRFLCQPAGKFVTEIAINPQEGLTPLP